MYDPQRLGDVSAAQAQVMLKELYGEAFLKEDSKKWCSNETMLSLLKILSPVFLLSAS